MRSNTKSIKNQLKTVGRFPKFLALLGVGSLVLPIFSYAAIAATVQPSVQLVQGVGVLTEASSAHLAGSQSFSGNSLTSKIATNGAILASVRYSAALNSRLRYPSATVAPTTTNPSAVAANLSTLKLMNYYPSQAAWTYMWEEWNLSTINRDFATIAALHANAVRIIIPTNTFGYPNPEPIMVSRLASIVASAESQGLKVQLTLFDWWGEYTDLAGSTNWASAVLAPYRNDPEIAFVELKNEVDPKNPAAMAWVRTELPIVEGIVGSIPVTVSVTGMDTPAVLTALKTALGSNQPDFYDVHYYGNAGAAYSELAQDKAIASPSSLFVGETGISTLPRSGQTEAQAESAQDMYLRSVEWATVALGLPAAAPWMLQDLTPSGIPPQEGGNPDQADFGLLRVDGSEKPAAVSISQFFLSGSVDTQFNSTFAGQSGGQPLDWMPVDSARGNLAWDPMVSHSGTGSVSLSNTGGTSAAVPAYQTSPIIVPTYAGQVSTASTWAEGVASTGSNRIAISWFNAQGDYLGQSESAHLPTGNTGWHQLTVKSTPPPGATYEEVSLKSSDNTGTVWFDDATFALVG